MSSENIHLLEKEIHGVFGSGYFSDDTFRNRIIALDSEYPYEDSQNYHMYVHAIQELNKKLDKFGLTSQIIQPVDAGFRPLSVESFFGEKLLRKFGGASVGYSLRDLYGNSANVVRVRRSTDNAERDFTASQIISNEMLNWVTAQSATADGFVSIWYDQSVYGYDAREPVLSYQPKIVDGGSIVTDTNGKIAINGKGAKLRLGHFSWFGESPREMLSDNGRHSVFVVCDLPDQTLGNASPFNTFVDVKSTSASIKRRPLIYLRLSDGTLAARTSHGYAPYGVDINAATAQSAQLITDIVNPSGTNQQTRHSLYVDGSRVAVQNFDGGIPSDSNTTLADNSILFDRAETVVDTYISEFIYYPSDQSTNRADIEENILNYYNI